jgi:hypothetical protein
MTVLPEPTPTAPAAGQATPTDADRDRIRRLFAAVDEIDAETPTAVRVEDPAIPSWKDGARIGDTPPVAQPGRAPMSQKAVDDTARMIGASVLVATTTGGTATIMYVSQFANPVVCGIVFGAPTALVLALGRLVKKAKGALPDVTVNNYDGATVYQDRREVRSKTTGVIVKNTNQQ